MYMYAGENGEEESVKEKPIGGRTAGMACDACCQIDVRNLLISQPAEPIPQPVQGWCEDLLNRGSRRKPARLFQVRSQGMWYVIDQGRKTGNSSNKRQILSVREGLAAEKGLFQFLGVTASGARQGLARSHRVSGFVFGRLSGARRTEPQVGGTDAR